MSWLSRTVGAQLPFLLGLMSASRDRLRVLGIRLHELGAWIAGAVLDIFHQLRWSYAPPLMVYLAAGLSSLTAIVGTFFVKEYLDLPAAFLAGLAFWAGIPWALKMPLGHLVDLIWRWKALLVYLGALLVGMSMLIMYGLIVHTAAMRAVMSAEAWYVLSTLLAPVGFVVQDVVADAMTVEAVPSTDDAGRPLAEAEIKDLHTTMQMLGRFALVAGLVLVALLNIFMFAGVESMSQGAKARIYADIYLLGLGIPVISVAGVVLGGIMLRRRRRELLGRGIAPEKVEGLLAQPPEEPNPNWWIFGGAIGFVVFTLTVGLSNVPFAQEIIFVGSMAIVAFLMSRLIRELDPRKAYALVGTAIVIFVFRAVPLPGAGFTWFEIDVLAFDQRFLSVLSLISSCLALIGMVVLRPLIASRSIVYIVAILSIAAAVLFLPYIGLYYGIHRWTESWSGGLIDARVIALVDTALESPLAQVSMIPLLAWIAKNAPSHLKATFFAVMSSFTNLALSASSLLTKYVNEIFVVTREVKNHATGVVEVPADYSRLGLLLIVVAILSVAMPFAAIYFVQRSKLRTSE